ncbi:MAG TPA: low molecular weight protein-tyrosine-phosphatase [Pseudomonadales bacterium]|nr:low molecular weight protein-tyrosine-phosphatase [Pseudomonadales bacterium]
MQNTSPPSPSAVAVKPVKVLFVCLGNICRSPTAHGVFEQRVREAGLADLIQVDSAATGAFHVGNPPDPRTQRAAAARGYDLSEQRARQVTPADFQCFDFILPMDRMNLGNLKALKPKDFSGHLGLFMEFSRQRQYTQVPDPYSDGPEGFELVLELVEDAAQGLLDHIRREKLQC